MRDGGETYIGDDDENPSRAGSSGETSDPQVFRFPPVLRIVPPPSNRGSVLRLDSSRPRGQLPSPFTPGRTGLPPWVEVNGGDPLAEAFERLAGNSDLAGEEILARRRWAGIGRQIAVITGNEALRDIVSGDMRLLEQEKARLSGFSEEVLLKRLGEFARSEFDRNRDPFTAFACALVVQEILERNVAL